MPVRTTLELGNPLLRQPAQAVEDVGSSEIQALLVDLWDTLHERQRQHPWLKALSAPILGVAQRVIVLEFDGQPLVLINPRFETWSREIVPGYEACITFSMIWGEVCRPAQVVVVALDAAGVEQRYDVDGDLARIMQHEMDHLDGLMWLDRDPDLATLCTTNEYLRLLQQSSAPQ